MFVSIKDIEHLYRKIIFNKVTPFDLSQFMDNLELILTINKILKKDKKIQKYIKENISEKIELTCQKILNKLTKHLNKSICELLTNNKFEINFFNKNVNELLDKTDNEFNQVEIKLKLVIDTFTDIIQNRDSKAKDPIKNS